MITHSPLLTSLTTLPLWSLPYARRATFGSNNITEASPAAIDINGLTPLFYSILHKSELKVTQLLLNHMNINRNSSSLSFPNGQTADGLVIAGGSCMEIIDQHGWQAIHYAAKYGLSGHLEKLLYYGCDINAKIRGSGNTPLHVAAINDQLQVIIVRNPRRCFEEIFLASLNSLFQILVVIHAPFS